MRANAFLGLTALSPSSPLLSTSLTWKQEHLPFLDPVLDEVAPIHEAQEHPSLVLVEPLLGLVDVVVWRGGASAESHHRRRRRRRQ